MKMSQSLPNFFDTDDRPASAAATGLERDRKLKVWAVLNAVEQGQLAAAEALAAYGISAEELEYHRAGWLELGAGRG